MKRTIKSIFLLGSLAVSTLVVNSCQDALDMVQPEIIQEEDIFVSVNNMNTYFNGSVMNLLEPNYEIYVTAVLTDEVKPGIGSGGQEFGLHRYILDPSTTLVESIWYSHYRVINRVNRLIKGAESVTPTTAAETTQYNTILAQARAIRAYCLLQLQTFFSEDMKNDNGLGVLIFDFVPADPLAINLPRATNAQTFDFINADLDFARTRLNYTTSTSPLYTVDRGFVNALSARMNLYRGKYDLAKQYAQDVIANSGLSLTVANPIANAASGALTEPVNNPAVSQTTVWNNAFYGGANGLGASFNPYRNLWNDTSRGEIIFSLGRPVGSGGLNIGARFNTNTSTATGSPMWNWGRNLFNIFYNTDGDIRRFAYLDPSSKIDPNYLTSSNPRSTDVLVVDKYPGKTSAAVRNDLKIFRLSEMYFILAEAAVEENQLGTAAGYIQQVRVARNYKGTATTPTYTNTQIAYQDILKERRVELALEGHRYIDLKRLANKAGVTMDRNQTDDDIAVTNLPNDSYKYTLPIPLAEINANPGIRGQQNTGY
ncbi:RagB/SusD family nutrient uptake outer membrane protein [Epilithonimonas arachidiradicis]|uniref:Putative outer membrane starch-binding protein n=1 Tax=Epilithonimonas arachidiradicis TaxID=1617282 RepID=A0A420DBK1_9FLAO|nr:RagB/SusD family nutrient uptake outer membrane protein [Epilithonimonas arachidiradicis]RKE88851.1 putative outer membrane starch-binding protein [Epilithonimonas arachidiradicis]GGG54580.1 hypothetical protein GCM10007332_15270 [Epilithonimonas arachidiradicis]